MVVLDDREEGILDHLVRLGIPVSVARLEHGDLVIQAANGWLIAYERKHLSDMLQCMEDRRLSGFQLKQMRPVYDRVEIILEGNWGVGDNGEITVPTRAGWTPYYFKGSGISYRQLDSFLYSQYELGGVPCWRTRSATETAHLYASRYAWWQKDYALHKSHDALYTNNPSVQKRGAVMVHNGAPNPVTLMAAQIPGLDAKSWDVGKHFACPFDMVNASQQEWQRVEWTDRKGACKHFSKDSAKRIVSWLRGKNV